MLAILYYLACVASGGARPFRLAHRLVGGVICVVNSINQLDSLNLLTSYAGHSRIGL